MKNLLILTVTVLSLSCGARQVGKSSYVFPNEQFLYWCVDPVKVWPVYIDRPDGCETEISRGLHSHYPLAVYADEALIPEVAEAIEVFNRQVGFELFVLDAVGSDTPDILIMVDGNHPFAAAEAKQFSIDGRHHGGVLVYNGLEDHDRADIMMHELGHIVGLRHDKSHMSIMYAGQGSRASMLEDRDVKALRYIFLK